MRLFVHCPAGACHPIDRATVVACRERRLPALEHRIREGLELLARYWWVTLPALLAVVCFVALGERPFRFEEGRRVVQALAIDAGRPWWRLETFGDAYVNKPPGLPWLLVVSGTLFGGYSEFAMRVPAALSVIGGAVTCALLAGRVAVRESAVAALAAGICFAATFAIFSTIRLAETDGPSVFLAGAAFLVWCAARLADRLSLAAWCAVAILLGAVIFIKGPVPALFPMLGIGIFTMRVGRPRERLAMAAAFLAAFVPVGAWYLVNSDVVTLNHLAREMRLRPAAYGYWLVQIGETPRVVLEGLAQSLPVLLLGGIWIVRHRAWRLEPDAWPKHALFLYAVPAYCLVLLWPGSNGRYAMPAMWPFAVMSGLLIADLWHRWAVPLLFGAMLAAFLTVQTVIIALAGETDYQRARRAEAVAIQNAVAQLPEGRILLLAGQPDYNRFAYIGRDGDWVAPEETVCPTPADGRFLLAERGLVEPLDTSLWRAVQPVGAGLILFERRQAAC